jgi:arylsulfatase A-like enzyme
MFRGQGCEPIDVRDYETTSTVHPGISPAQLDYLYSQYEGEIRWTDEQLGKFFGFLKERGLWDNTVVIITADHGEEFFDHGEKGHYHNLYAETVHVPLIVKYAGSSRHGRDTRLASLVDVMPTALALAGAPADKSIDCIDLLGEPRGAEQPIFYELVSFWRERTTPEQGILGKLLPGGAAPVTTTSMRTWFGVRQDTHKLVASPDLGRFELYDVATDPFEKKNIAAFDKARADTMLRKIETWQHAARQAASVFGRGGSAELSPEDEERLRSLGYIQ